MLSDAERERYSRQIRLFAEEGQERLKKKIVFIAGAGGLGSVISLYMAASGFGRIRIADCDSVDLSNLNRQILHGSLDLGRSKAQSALETLSDINPEGEIEALQEKISAENINALVQGCDMIMDAMGQLSGQVSAEPCRFREKDSPLSRRHQRISGAGNDNIAREDCLSALHLSPRSAGTGVSCPGLDLRGHRLHSG